MNDLNLYQHLIGTPARLDGRTINYDGLIIQEGDNPPSPFSYLNKTVPHAVSFYFFKQVTYLTFFL